MDARSLVSIGGAILSLSLLGVAAAEEQRGP
jgi:hypothetical protein